MATLMHGVQRPGLRRTVQQGGTHASDGVHRGPPFRPTRRQAHFSALVMGTFVTIAFAAHVTGEQANRCGAQAGNQAAAMRSGTRVPTLSDSPVYVISATLAPADGAAYGEVCISFTNTSPDPLRYIPIRLYANAEAIYGGSSRVTAASVDGEAADVRSSEDATLLVLRPATPVAISAQAEIRMTFETRSAQSGGYGILATRGDRALFAGWYPMLPPLESQDGPMADPAAAGLVPDDISSALSDWRISPVPHVGDALDADTAFLEATLRAPSGWTIVTTGSEVERRVSGESSEWRFVSGPAREFAVAALRNGRPLTVTESGLAIHYYAGSSGGRTTATDAAEMARQAYAELAAVLGPLPYRELDVVEADITLGGYEFSGLVAIDHLDRTTGPPGRTRWLITHEIAHQWWYGVVGSPTVSEPWLDEGFATYSVYLALERTDPPAAERMVAEWQREYDRGGGPPVASPAYGFSSWQAYRGPVYYRGALLLHDLRAHLGDGPFLVLLTDLQSMFRWRHLTLASLESYLARHHGAAAADVIRRSTH